MITFLVDVEHYVVVCLPRDMRPFMLCMTSLKLTVTVVVYAVVFFIFNLCRFFLTNKRVQYVICLFHNLLLP